MNLTRPQRGAAALATTLVLLAAALLAMLFAHRDGLLDQRMTANQWRAARAFEAAEAGLDWATAQLNRPGGIDAACLDSAADASFRERLLRIDPASGRIDGATWASAGAVTPLRAACVLGDAGGSCSCPSAGAATPAVPAGHELAPAFSVEFAHGGRPGLVRVTSSGCTRFGGACRPGSGTAAEAGSRVEALLALLPGLRQVPSAPLLTPGAVDAASASLGVHHADPATGGIAVHAGRAIDAPLARITPPAGTSIANALAGDDDTLAAFGPDALFGTLFGLSKAAWAAQPAVTPFACRGECSAALAGAIGANLEHRLIAVRGNLSLAGPASFGSAARPVIVVVDGELRLDGAVRVHGLLYARRATWNGSAGPGGLLRGALVAEAGVTVTGAPDLVHDAAVLASLRATTGSFVRVPGSWRDF